MDELDGESGYSLAGRRRSAASTLPTGSAEIEAVQTAIAIRRTYLAPVFV